MKFKSRWYDRDFHELKEANILSEIVTMYGAYLLYSSKIDDMSSFVSYYNKNKIPMQHIFINTATKELKSILQEQGINSISGRKIRQLCFTNKKRIVKSYSWISDFLNILFSNLKKNAFLIDFIVEEFLQDCSFCENENELKYVLTCCVNKILGFQYNILKKFSQYSNKKGECAKECLYSIVKSEYILYIQDKCSFSRN